MKIHFTAIGLRIYSYSLYKKLENILTYDTDRVGGGGHSVQLPILLQPISTVMNNIHVFLLGTITHVFTPFLPDVTSQDQISKVSSLSISILKVIKDWRGTA